jgi:hypothetical protein
VRGVGGEGRCRGQGGELTQTMYAYMNKWINNLKNKVSFLPATLVLWLLNLKSISEKETSNTSLDHPWQIGDHKGTLCFSGWKIGIGCAQLGTVCLGSNHDHVVFPWILSAGRAPAAE